MRYPLISLPIANTHDPFQLNAPLDDFGMDACPSRASMPHGGGPWRAIEFVSFPPGHRDVEPHPRTTDALHFTLAGQGELVSDDDPCQVEVGVLTSAPAGSTFAIANTSFSEELVLFVAELAVPDDALDYPPSFCHLVRELHPSDHFHPVFKGSQRIRPVMATVHLRHAFAAPWGTFSLVVVPPGCRVEPYIEPDQDQVLVVMRGKATFTIPKGRGTVTEPNNLDETLLIDSDSQLYQSVFVPCGMPCGFLNQPSEKAPLFVACLTVLRTNL